MIVHSSWLHDSDTCTFISVISQDLISVVSISVLIIILHVLCYYLCEVIVMIVTIASLKTAVNFNSLFSLRA